MSKHAFDNVVFSVGVCVSEGMRQNGDFVIFNYSRWLWLWLDYITVWHSSVCCEKKEAAPSHCFSLETLPGPHQRPPSFLPLPFLASSITHRFPSTLLPTALGHAQQKHQQNIPPDAKFSSFCFSSEKKITVTHFHYKIRCCSFTNKMTLSKMDV